MAQGLLAFKYEEEKQAAGMTALAGLPVYLENSSSIDSILTSMLYLICL